MLKLRFGLMAALLLALGAGNALASARTSARLADGCCAPPAKCVYNPCIKYNHRKGCKVRCCGCECPTPVQIVLAVQDPCCCECVVEVPVCILACGEMSEPCVTSRCGVLGRGVVTYTWANGYKVRVVFTKGGDIVVTTFGR